ncbi:unnamed protein product [Schistocephalus solidus]|uniref:Integrase catalytic domain-containing protein n=1 Tax=Schistocephalus solidus TaxID=70667 RepID=A0A3P7CKI1_SCHSO|nr:unnamed protein product [Schistocephalus solidus]
MLMQLDTYRPGIHIVHKTNAHLNSRHMHAPTCLSTTTVHNLLFADDGAPSTAMEKDIQRILDLFAVGSANIELTSNTDKTVSKVQRHNKAPIGIFPGPGARFSYVHLDIVGSLPPSDGCSHLLTCVDRFTRWPEAIPLPGVSASTVVKAFHSHWVAIFGAPPLSRLIMVPRSNPTFFSLSSPS